MNGRPRKLSLLFCQYTLHGRTWHPCVLVLLQKSHVNKIKWWLYHTIKKLLFCRCSSCNSFFSLCLSLSARYHTRLLNQGSPDLKFAIFLTCGIQFLLENCLGNIHIVNAIGSKQQDHTLEEEFKFLTSFHISLAGVQHIKCTTNPWLPSSCSTIFLYSFLNIQLN